MNQHSIEEYAHLLDQHGLLKEKNYPPAMAGIIIDQVDYNSQLVLPNTLFVCKGAGFKEEYLDMAIDHGAIIYISEWDYNKSIPCLLVKDVQKALSLAAILYYDHPGKKLKLIGITGTKGKSTAAYYLKYILDDFLKARHQKDAGIISSIDYYDGLHTEEAHLTTPESLEFQMHLHNAVESGLEYVVTEVSSQALKYNRLYDVCFEVVVFLNISDDHISPVEHPDREDYFLSKLQLFTQGRTACVNLDSDDAERVLEAARHSSELITFGTDPRADIYAYQVHKDGFETVFKVRTNGYDQEFRLTMPGLFNVENALAAIAVSYALEIPEKYVYSGLIKARSSGRMEIYYSRDQEKIVIVDYAHNKLSFNKLYESAKMEFPDRWIITVFGCPGGKAFIRRRDLGILSGMHSDKVYLTAEDPGAEDVRHISEDIAQYVRLHNDNCEIIDDRAEAIRASIMSSGPKTLILLTGKGNETTQKFGQEYVPYPSDVECALKFLHEYDETCDSR